MGIKGSSITKFEALLRLLAFFTLFLAAIITITDRQTKVFFGAFRQTANYKLANIAKVYVYVHFIGAGYSLLQLVRCLALTNQQLDKLSFSGHILKWSYFSLDQVAVYLVFATNCALIEMAFLVLTGVEVFEWMKLCNKFTRFCVHIGGGILCGFVGFIILAAISGISTFNLFRWYSPNFLCLKPKKIGIVALTNREGFSKMRAL